MDFPSISFLSGSGCGICIGLSLYAIQKYRSFVKGIETINYSSDGNYQIALVVRTDLNMTKGKIAAQCGHASVGAVEKAQKKDPALLKEYKSSGQTKIAVKIDSEEGIKRIRDSAKELGLITSLIRDAGRTQIAANSITVLAVGPAPQDIISKVIGHLKPL